MRKYAQPKTASPARRDASLSLRLQKLQEAVSTLQGDLELAVAAGLLPSGWTVTQSDETRLVIDSCGFGRLDARAMCGSDSVDRLIPISVEITPTITVTPAIPEDWVYEAPTGGSPERIIAYSSGTGTIEVSADNGGGYVETRSIGLEVEAGAPAFEWVGNEVSVTNLNATGPLIYSGSLPGHLSFIGSYSMPSGGGQISTRIIIPGYADIETIYDLAWQW